MKKILRIDYILIGLVIGFFIFQFFREKKHEKLLETSEKCFGLIKEIHYNSAIHGSAYSVVSYKIGSKEFSFKQLGDFRKLSIGDTVMIEYSKTDYSVAQVIDKFYMKKYQHLKN